MTLTNDDFKAFKDLINQTIEDRTEDLLVTKEDIGHLPTKSEFYEMEDKLIKRLDNIDQEFEILKGLQRKVNTQETRIDKIEKKLDIPQAA